VSALDGPRIHLRLTDSTNDRARELALAGAPTGTVVTADEQTAGRGRLGRRWSAPAGAALLCSTILRPLAARQALLPLAVPIAVCEAAEALAPVACRIKWPNDVWLDERKLAGVLMEARPPDWAVIGVGLNLAIADDQFPDDLRWPATSLGHGVTADQALAALREALGTWTAASPEDVAATFAERDALRGRQVSWEGAGGASGSGSGRAAGIDERGNLVVESDAGERRTLGSGEVSLRLTHSE
jgi:BirA family biotin operon repressor/biotin-[acetyl-CoA-carboxylase] ligase